MWHLSLPPFGTIQTPSSYRNHTQQLQWHVRCYMLKKQHKHVWTKIHFDKRKSLKVNRTLKVYIEVETHTHTHTPSVFSTALQPIQVLLLWANAMRPPTFDVNTVLQRVWSPSERYQKILQSKTPKKMTCTLLKSVFYLTITLKKISSGGTISSDICLVRSYSY